VPMYFMVASGRCDPPSRVTLRWRWGLKMLHSVAGGPKYREAQSIVLAFGDDLRSGDSLRRE
jgi:hypothetical protein